MRTAMYLVGVLAVAAVGAMLVHGQPDRPAAPLPAVGRTITVVGTGIATGKPDSARVTFAVSTRADAVPDGRTRTAATVRKVQTAIADLKLADVRTLTAETWVRQALEQKEPYKLLGYDVWQSFTARIRRDDPDRLAADIERVYDAGLANGANADGGVYFFRQDETALR